MNPSMCRQVFFDEQQSHNAAAGSSNQGAAMVMSHSDQQWDNLYDMHYHPRVAQNAVDGMQSWRAAILQLHTPVAAAVTLSKPLHCEHVLVLESEESQYQSCCSDSDIEVELDRSVMPNHRLSCCVTELLSAAGCEGRAQPFRDSTWCIRIECLDALWWVETCTCLFSIYFPFFRDAGRIVTSSQLVSFNLTHGCGIMVMWAWCRS